MNDHDALEQLAPDPVAQADDGAPGTASDALLLWKELRDYRHRRDAWECDLYRLVQSHRDLEARHWQLVLHAIEATAAREERDARSGLLTCSVSCLRPSVRSSSASGIAGARTEAVAPARQRTRDHRVVSSSRCHGFMEDRGPRA
jgi:hypothetical protein